MRQRTLPYANRREQDAAPQAADPQVGHKMRPVALRTADPARRRTARFPRPGISPGARGVEGGKSGPRVPQGAVCDQLAGGPLPPPPPSRLRRGPCQRWSRGEAGDPSPSHPRRGSVPAGLCSASRPGLCQSWLNREQPRRRPTPWPGRRRGWMARRGSLPCLKTRPTTSGLRPEDSPPCAPWQRRALYMDDDKQDLPAQLFEAIRVLGRADRRHGVDSHNA